MSVGVSVSDLSAAPEFADTIADRIQAAWWRGRATRDEMRARVRAHLSEAARAFVAHDGPNFLGTISLVADDLPERAALSPWAAALWVKPAARRKGIGALLLAHAAEAAFAHGAKSVYLCAEKRLDDYYLGRGWRKIESDVGARGLSVFDRRDRSFEWPPNSTN